ncbi:hypothetical protein [Comamonas sp. NLF-1-9]|uniref:hypothetical protein n=1 Tax=Comamonas sp. NLF-1-9 TaxID=2853163 RepID=UPI001C449D60|nr:hypothetical protein [Comamonas sp. NLF-1-9]QXL84822.1 hypothetical protein KUD94_02165 [Comamonas sp. NLF-1-9]
MPPPAKPAKSNPELEAAMAQARQVIGCDNDRDYTKVREIWAREPQRSLQPAAIRDPSDYAGQERLSIACTQTDLPAKKQAALVQQWCELLPTLTQVRWLYFMTRVPQPLFDAACRMPGLVGLYIKWSGIESLEPLTRLRDLQYFHLGESASVSSIAPLAQMKSLKWLQLDGLRKIESLEPLRHLSTLEGLGFVSAESRVHVVDSFEPLSALTRLQWLNLGPRPARLGLQPLHALKGLEYLGLPNKYSVHEFAELSLHVPAHVCERLQPFMRFHCSVFPCKTCQSNWLVLTSGKGSRLLCPTCDTEKLARHMIIFRKAVGAAQAAARSPSHDHGAGGSA